ncbi:MAG TPA: hypothetical protein VLM05_05335, partial [Mycobacteriales bacterium]|nr:hypothetical protein [Mycobacteriales bacterium]
MDNAGNPPDNVFRGPLHIGGYGTFGGMRMLFRSRLLAAGVVLAFCGLLVVPAGASASGALGRVVSANPANYTPDVRNGAVYKVAEYRGVMYAGGSFTAVSAAGSARTVARSRLVAFNAANGAITSFAPRINGTVWALAAYGGSVYVGGSFTTVNGVRRPGLVKLNSVTGAVDPRFNAKLSGAVTDLAVVNGRLVASGTFGARLAALRLATGANTGYLNLAVRGSVARNAGPTQVYRFAVNRAGTRLVGVGNFTSVGGKARYRAFML